MYTVVIVELHLLVNKIMTTLTTLAPFPHTIESFFKIILKMDKLNLKYHNFQNFYYTLYIESFSKQTLRPFASRFVKLAKTFHEVCRLLDRAKQILTLYGVQNHNINKLGLQEIKVLVKYKDIKQLMDDYNLYSILYSNYCIDS